MIRMRRPLSVLLLLFLAAAGCYQRRDPVVDAAQNLNRMAQDMVAQDEKKTQQLNSLRLGMSDSEVLSTAGPPSARNSRLIGDGESQEVWTYRGAMRTLATLTFVNQRLTEIRIE